MNYRSKRVLLSVNITLFHDCNLFVPAGDINKGTSPAAVQRNRLLCLTAAPIAAAAAVQQQLQFPTNYARAVAACGSVTAELRHIYDTRHMDMQHRFLLLLAGLFSVEVTTIAAGCKTAEDCSLGVSVVPHFFFSSRPR